MLVKCDLSSVKRRVHVPSTEDWVRDGLGDGTGETLDAHCKLRDRDPATRILMCDSRSI